MALVCHDRKADDADLISVVANYRIAGKHHYFGTELQVCKVQFDLASRLPSAHIPHNKRSCVGIKFIIYCPSYIGNQE